MKKRILSLLIVLCLVCGMIPAISAAKLDNGLEYKVYADHVEITGYTGSSSEVIIPAEIEGLPVTTIGYEAFFCCEHITSVTIPESVTTIGAYAFRWCTSLTTILIPGSVITIGEYAFSVCTSLNNVILSDGITSIEDGTFEECENLINVTIPKSITHIGSGVFSFCNRLNNISVDKGNPYYSNDSHGVLFNKEKHELIQAPGAFQGAYSIPDGVVSIRKSAFAGCKNLSSLTIPKSITTIGDQAFLSCSNLTNIVLPNSITSLGNRAFCYCYNLSAVKISNSLTSIGYETFYECSSLTDIIIPDSIITIGTDAFSECGNLTNVILGNNLVNIGDFAFFNCSSLENINLPYSVTDIGSYSFCGCSRLSKITIPDNVKNIGSCAFASCNKLGEITIPDCVTNVGESAFANCNSMEKIVIGTNVISIGGWAFDSCKNLSNIIFRGNVPYIGIDAFSDVSAHAYYPANNTTWIADVMQDYGGTITWVPYDPSNPFTDMEEGRFYYEPVLWAVDNGITYGLTDTEFGTEESCKRSQVVTFLWRAAGSPAPNSTAHSFVDVKKGSFYEKAVLWAVENGITVGIDSTHFDPDAPCTRSEVVTFLWRAADKPAASGSIPFSDVPANKWYAQPVLWAVQNGITYGMTDTLFDTEGICTRAQVVTFLYRAYT